MARKQLSKKAKRRQLEVTTEEKLREAREALSNGTFKHISQAARHFGVSYHTLRRRCLGLNAPKSKVHVSNQLLNEAQEKTVCDEVLQKKTNKTGKRQIPSRNWVYPFLSRNPDLALRRPTGLDPKRAQCFNPTVQNDIPWENIYNMDEKGIQLGGGRKMDNTRFLYSREQSARTKLQSASLELVTVLECVSADGSSLKPGFVLSGKCILWDEYFEEDGIMVALSEKGWTSDYIGLQWFEKLFIPQAKARNITGKPILLIYDGHHSHESIELCEAAVKANIDLFALPPHTSHRLQPLDVGVFGPLQRAWQKQCSVVLDETGGGITHQNFIKEYLVARTESFKESTILSAWKKSGIRPLNPQIFSKFDFAPSFCSSTNPPLPETFPHSLGNPEQSASLEGDGSDENSDPGHSLGPEMVSNAGGAQSAVESMAESINRGSTPNRGTPVPTRSCPEFPVLAQSVTSAQTQDDNIAPSVQDSMPDSEISTTQPRRSLRLEKAVPVPGPIPDPLSQLASRQSQLSGHSILASMIDRSTPMEVQLADSERENSVLRDTITNLIAMNSSLQTHCYYAGQTIVQQQQLLNAKTGKKNSQCRAERPINGSRVLTSEEGRRHMKRIREEAELKEQRAAEELARKASEDEARRIRRADYTRVFTGPLNKSRRKEDLEDIAVALALPEVGKKDELVDRILSHFEKKPCIEDRTSL
ncbi:DDE superfamily endonuclease-domain-containing protein [Lactarius akahatsu]|uniref:DDE superfamily endonuclease-domain-containing protein n=1 Tax=Lactarius akahatsu TaxID=416441 RepID=A0AAD4QF67_9AGAM|nr:DDE superfamily endonuclease-domain-containing protein [Lactarius akahatsu]